MQLLPETMLFHGTIVHGSADPENLLHLIARFSLNFAVVLIIVRGIYYPVTRRKDYLFTYLLFSVVVFFLCHLLASVRLELGFALGLFAIFSILRYRTDPIPIKEMTYLFVIIGISVINALVSERVGFVELVFANTMLLFLTYGLEKLWLIRHESCKMILYEKIELVKPENRALLLQDLRERTGLDIHRFVVRKIDFLRDTAQVFVYYYEQDAPPSVYDSRVSQENNQEDD